MKESQLAKRLAPYLYNLLGIEKLQNRVSSNGSGGSGTGVLEPHAMNGLYHEGIVGNSQIPQVPLLNGNRAFTGDVDFGDNNIINVDLVDGVDLPAHVSNPSAHHNPVTVGDYAIDVSAGQELTFNAADGLIIDAFGVNIDLADDSGLTLATGQLAMGTPGTLGVGSTNSLSGDYHSHAVDDSNNPGAAAKILASTSAGGLTLEHFQSNGEITALQSLYAGASGFRVLHHTHDYDHVHVVVNPTGGWTLDEQFGVDIDDNLLVRGWIVGKHAIQLEGATMLVHFDGPDPYELNYAGTPMGHMGQTPTVSGGVIYRPGKFGKAIQLAEAATNLCTNPSFETGLTNWTTFNAGSGNLAATQNSNSYIGASAAKLTSTVLDTSQFYNFFGSFTSGNDYTFSLWMKASEDTTVDIKIKKHLSPFTNYASTTVDVTEEWQRFHVTYLNASATEGGRISIEPNTAGVDIYVDAVQMEATAYMTPYLDGSLDVVLDDGSTGNHSWSSTVHGSNSSRTATSVVYSTYDILDADEGSIMAYVYLSDLTGGIQYIFSNFTTDDISLFVNASGNWVASVDAISRSIAATAREWTHLALTWKNGTAKFYVNAVQVGADINYTNIDIASAVTLGNRPGSNIRLNGFLDEVGIFGTELDEDQIRAVYESNAPVFAETATFHWRAGRNRVWADSEGLWALNASGTKMLGLYAGDEENPAATKSWGGVSLGESDLLLGDASRGAYMHWDDSAGTMVYAGQIIMKPGSSGINNFSDAGALATLDDITLSYLTDAGSLAGLDNINLSYVTDAGALAGLNNINLSYVTDAGNLASADDMDDIANGSTYAKIRGTALNGSGLVVLDATIDGTYAKVRSAIVSAGYIQVSSGGSVKDSNLNGWNIGSSEIVGQLAGVDQVVMNTSGKLIAGAGQVEIGRNGITIDTTDFDDAILIFKSGLSGSVRGSISFLESPPSLPNSGMNFLNNDDTGFHFRGGTVNLWDGDLNADENVNISGDLDVTGTVTIDSLMTTNRINSNETYAAGLWSMELTNNQTSSGHVLKLTTGGTGGGTKALEVNTGAKSPMFTVFGDDIVSHGIHHFDDELRVGTMAEPSNAGSYAQIYVDSADNHLKVKMKNGTVRTLAID